MGASKNSGSFFTTDMGGFIEEYKGTWGGVGRYRDV